MNGKGIELESEVARVIAPLCGARVLVALSGGADSVALLTALHRLGADTVAAHCNFHLRGEESNRDCRFVTDLCRKLKVELRTIDFDVEGHRRRTGGSMEMACRRLRYDWFAELCAEHGCVRVVTAHHADDNVETMLLNLLRGCGLEGVKGMVVDNGTVMRPLLRLHRCDIEDYLRRIGQDWIVDSTNLQDEPDRNFLRLRVLPLLGERFNDASRRLARSQRDLTEDYALFRQWSREYIDSDILYIKVLSASASPLTLLHEWLCGTLFTSAQQQEMLRESRRAGGGTRMWQAGDMIVLLDADKLRRMPAEMPAIRIGEEEASLTPDLMKVIKATDGRETAYFPRPLSGYRLRTPRRGERMRISPRATKKVSDLLAEAGVPMPYRSQYTLLADAETDKPLWIPFVRRAFADLVRQDAVCCYRLTARWNDGIPAFVSVVEAGMP